MVPDERVETLVRALVEHLAAFGGIPLVTVFDRPKTIALQWGRNGVVTEWNPTFAGVALDLGIGVEVCWAYRPQEKGSVENLVGWVKGSFFKQRRFLDLDALFKGLHLANARRVWRGLIDRAERKRWSYRDVLTLLTTEEIAHRQQTRLARLTRRGHFPFLKTIDDFNFTYQSSLRLQMLGSALAADFVTEGRSLISGRQTGARQDAPGDRGRVPRHSERLRCLLHHRGRTRRRSVGRVSRRRAGPRAADLHAARRPRRR